MAGSGWFLAGSGWFRLLQGTSQNHPLAGSWLVLRTSQNQPGTTQNHPDYAPNQAHLNPCDLNLTSWGQVRSNLNPAIWTALYDFLSMFNSNICPNVDRFQDKPHLNPCHLMRSSEVKSDATIWKALYDFLSMFNSNICPNVDRFQDKGHLNPGDLDLTSWGQVWSGHLKGLVWLPILV